MRLGSPISEAIFLNYVVKDALRLTKDEFETLLVTIGQYTLSDLRDPFLFKQFGKRELILRAFEEGDTWQLLRALREAGAFTRETLAALAQEGVNLEEPEDAEIDEELTPEDLFNPIDLIGLGPTEEVESVEGSPAKSPSVEDGIGRPARGPGLLQTWKSLHIGYKVFLVATLGGALLTAVCPLAGEMLKWLIDRRGASIREGTATPVASARSTSPPPTPTVQPTVPPTATSSPSPLVTAITPTSEIVPTANACTQPSTLSFEETFDSNDRQWVVEDDIDFPFSDESRSIGDGVYHYSAYFETEAYSTSPIPRVNPKDFWLGFEATITNKSGEGQARIAVKFREQEDGYYLARFGDDGAYTLTMFSGGSPSIIVPWTETSAFQLLKGETNEFVVRVDEWVFTLCVNGTELFTTTDREMNSSGRVGIGLGGEAGVTVIADFDNVRLTPP